MGIIKLVFLRIKSDFLSGKAMFILYLLGTMLSVLAFIYFYGNFIPAFQELEEAIGDSGLRTYNANFDKPFQITKETLNVLDGLDIEKLSLSGKYTFPGDEYYTTIDAVSDNEDIKNRLIDYKIGETPVLSDEEFLENIIIIGQQCDYNKPTVIINNVEFRVIRVENNFCCMMPTKAFLDMKFEANRFSFVLKNKLNTDENYQLINDVSKALSDESKGINVILSDPLMSISNNNKDSQIFVYFLQLCLIYILCFISCALLFNYMFKKNIKENVIYMILGAKKSVVFLIAVLEVMVLSLAVSVISVLIHSIFYKLFFVGINNYNIQYSIIDYLAIIVFVTLLSLMVMIPFLISVIKNTAMNLRTKYV